MFTKSVMGLMFIKHKVKVNSAYCRDTVLPQQMLAAIKGCGWQFWFKCNKLGGCHSSNAAAQISFTLIYPEPWLSPSYYYKTVLNRGLRSDWPHWPLTLTCDLQFQSTVSHGSDPHTCKRSRPRSVASKNRVETDGGMDRWTYIQTENGCNCITSHVNAVGKKT